MDRADRRGGRIVRRPPRRGLGFTVVAGCVVGAVVVLTAISHATAEIDPALIGAALIGLTVVVELVAGPRRSELWHWVVILAVLVVVAAAYVTRAPLSARWAVSESAFDRTLTTLPPSVGSTWSQPGQATVPGRLGLYRVAEVDVVPAGYLFDDPDGGQLSDTGKAGFAYLPAGPADIPPELGLVLHHLRGPWYSYWQAS